MNETPAETRDPLAPIDTAVSVLATFILVLLVISVAATTFGSGSMMGNGTGCVTVDQGTLGVSGGGPAADIPIATRVDENVTTTSSQTRVCVHDADAWQQAVAAAPGWVSLALFLGFAWLTRRLVRTARRTGLFTRAVARRTRTIGWYLLVGGLVSSLATLLAGSILVDSVTDGIRWTDDLDQLTTTLPWTLLLVAAGVLTFARVLERAVPLQDDADATI